MSETARRAIEVVERKLGGRAITVCGGVLCGAPLVPGSDQLEQLMAAWRFDEPTTGWNADGAEA